MIPTLQAGQAGRWFAPADPLFANVVLLIDAESGEDGGNDFIDRSRSARVLTSQSNVQIDKALHNFGSRSALLDGSVDGLTAVDTANLALGTSDWCVECAVYFRVLTGAQFLIGQSDNAGSNTTLSFALRKDNTTNIITGFCCSGSSVIGLLNSASAVSATTWYHLAMQRSGSDFSLHINGILEDTASSASSVNNSSNLLGVGRLGEVATSVLDGNIDDVRMTVGATRYPMAGDFTPPNMPHPLR